MNNDPDYISAETFKKWTDLPNRIIYSTAKMGELGIHAVGDFRHKRFDREDVKRFCAKRNLRMGTQI